ncbi:hypothetical protein AH06_00520 [candidate division TM6 bacterium Zodletone_IIa]|nr:hypothetical protein AH06_00520 [candidate division TM6 bacterium Zodletone_IIa]
MAEFGAEGFMYEGARQVDSGVGGIVSFAGVDLNQEFFAALVGGFAVAGIEGTKVRTTLYI